MVKTLDEISYPRLEDHVGLYLWRLSELWKSEFDARMVEKGHAYFAEARSNVLRYVDRDGTSQKLIAARMGLSKQAVQQLIDDLASDGVVRRLPDPRDKRGKLVLLTQDGIRALHDANRVKKQIEQKYKKMIGPAKLSVLVKLLDELAVSLLKE
jgi:DNA-binding MarR family transcriptional regulator